MRSNRKHTVTELAQCIQLYEAGYSYRDLCENHGLVIDYSTFIQYYYRFLEHSQAGLERSGETTHTVKRLSKALFKNTFKPIFRSEVLPENIIFLPIKRLEIG